MKTLKMIEVTMVSLVAVAVIIFVTTVAPQVYENLNCNVEQSSDNFNRHDCASGTYYTEIE